MLRKQFSYEKACSALRENVQYPALSNFLQVLTKTSLGAALKLHMQFLDFLNIFYDSQS